jgi:acetolactate decarboxylase
MKVNKVLLIAALLFTQNVFSQNVRTAGTMFQVMMQGDLSARIFLDTITNKQHLFGLGPAENLQGELLVIDGRSYLAKTVNNNKNIQVTETFDAKGAFLVYNNVTDWKKIPVPVTVTDLKKLEALINQYAEKIDQPFAYRMITEVDTAGIHIVNQPADAKKVMSHSDPHGQQFFTIKNERVDVVGFFSRKHKGVFTHHDSFMHSHLINEARTKMGHLDGIKMKPNTTVLYLPAEIFTSK